jgi:hypothetical protein
MLRHSSSSNFQARRRRASFGQFEEQLANRRTSGSLHAGADATSAQPQQTREASFRHGDGKLLYIKSEKGYFDQVPPERAWVYQRPIKSVVTFTARGLTNLRHRYDLIHGAPAFVHRLLRLDRGSPEVQALLQQPELHPYFPEERFLVIPAHPLNPEFPKTIGPKSQKLRATGIALCAWFIHPGTSTLTDESRQLLHELAQTGAVEKPLLARLRSECAPAPTVATDITKRDAQTIGQLKSSSDYLASLLDLNATHIPLLLNLKQKMSLHLSQHYGVGPDDCVHYYFHFPYSEVHVTLHLHARVNHGLHPFERSHSFSIDDIVAGLKQGKSTHDLILERQPHNQGGFHRFGGDPNTQMLRDTEGIDVTDDVPNPFRLRPTAGTDVPPLAHSL